MAGTFGMSLMIKGLMATTTSHDTVREERGWRVKGIAALQHTSTSFTILSSASSARDTRKLAGFFGFNLNVHLKGLTATTTSHDTLRGQTAALYPVVGVTPLVFEALKKRSGYTRQKQHCGCESNAS